MPYTIYLWHNGQVMAFDEAGKQIPEWQGEYEVILARLLSHKWTGIIEMKAWPR